MSVGGGLTDWRDSWRGPLVLLLAITLWRLWLAAALPPVLDEAYYFHWARHLAWGYFDHPPGVAVLGLGILSAPDSSPVSVLAARLGALLSGVLIGLMLWRLYRAAGLAGRDLTVALLLALGTVPGLVVGVLTTPDTVLALAWVVALHEALAALRGSRRRWLSAGLATGLGLLGKYTMLLIGPVFLWALLLVDRRALATRWPYLGGLLALLVVLPHLAWNAQHDWLTLRFQFGHGFATATGPLGADTSALPAAVGAGAYVATPPSPMAGGERAASLGGYLLAQLGLWGLLLIPLGMALSGWLFGWLGAVPARASQRAATDAPRPATALDPAARHLLGAAALFPLLLFAGLSLVSGVEPNWPAMYLAAAAPFAALALRGLGRWVLAAVALHVLLLSLYAVHAAYVRLPLPDAADRVLRETQGYALLAARAASLSASGGDPEAAPTPERALAIPDGQPIDEDDLTAGLDQPPTPPIAVFADRYQVAAMLNLYQPGLNAPQWPGITRPSEYVRGVIAPFPTLTRLQRDGFWLVSRRLASPEIPGFQVDATETAFACKGEPLAILDGLIDFHAGPCPQPLRVWRLYRYRATP